MPLYNPATAVKTFFSNILADYVFAATNVDEAINALDAGIRSERIATELLVSNARAEFMAADAQEVIDRNAADAVVVGLVNQETSDRQTSVADLQTYVDAADALRVTKIPVTFALAVGVDGTTGTGKTNPICIPYAMTITKAYINATTGPTGADFIVDINKNGTTIWATQGNRVKIAAGATSGTQTSFDTTSLVEGDLLTIDVDQIGSTIPGQSITVLLLMTKA